MSAVLVHIDLDGDQPDGSSMLALAAGRHVASSWGATLYAALVIHDPMLGERTDATPRMMQSGKLPRLERVQAMLARAGADKVLVALTDVPVAPLWAAIGGAWQVVLDHLRPRLVLFGADAPSAAELAPRTSARIGARLLVRARAIGVDAVELRDRDGGYVRIDDGGAAVAMIGRADRTARGDEDVDVLLLHAPGGADARLELAGTRPAEVAHTRGALIALGEDVSSDPQITEAARRLADLLGGDVVAQPALDRSTPLTPELCVTIGAPQLDLAGASRLVKIGGGSGKFVEGALPSLAAVIELAKRLEGE